MLGKHKVRIVHIWMGRAFIGVMLYRIERGLFLTFGRFWSLGRVVFSPIFYLLYAYSNLEINYRADIGPGILVLHASMGCVVSAKSVIGRNLTLTGGNVIGARAGCPDRGIVIGNDCSLGANAVILGPVRLANNIKIGAAACVVRNELNDCRILVGVPAKPIK